MKLTASQLMVIFDTLRGSLAIKDNGQLFTFGEQNRRDVMVEVAAIMDRVSVSIEQDTEEEK